MAKDFRIKIKQRWEFKQGDTRYIAEVIAHPYPSAPYADLRIKQIVKGSNPLYKGAVICAQYLLSAGEWTYLEGQDKP